MNNVRNKILAAVIGIFAMSAAHAGGTYTTHDSNGNAIATFTQVQGPGKFGEGWKVQGDSSGIIWGAHALQNYYANNPIKPDQNNLVVESALFWPYNADTLLMS